MINTVIIRIPDDDGVKTFVGLSYANGTLESAGMPFSVSETDDYNRLTYGHIVLAHYDEKIQSSLALVTYEVQDEEIFNMGWNNIKTLAIKLIREFESQNKPH
jgi:hypothetical protein